MGEPRSKYVVVEDASLRLQRIWGRVSERVQKHSPGRSGSRRAVRLGALALLGAGLSLTALWFAEEAPLPSAWEDATLETASDTLVVDLRDGSRIQLAAETRLQVQEDEAKRVEVALERGRVECDVTEEPERRFSVRALGVEVRVTGTRFTVEVKPGGAVSVEVQRGSVEMHRAEGARVTRLGAGERWSSAPRAMGSEALAVADAQEDERQVEAPSVPDDHRAVSGPPGDVQGHRADDVRDGIRSPKDDADDENDTEASELEASGAKALLERANAARRAGDTAAAVKAYETLLAEHPSDGRAGLAAFELGRLRMDRLGDMPGAVTALKRAVTLAPGAGFREDAMARLVSAYDAMGSKAACRRAKEAYLSRYPSGVHAGAISKRCP